MSANPYKRKKKPKEPERPDWAAPFAGSEEATDGTIHAALRKPLFKRGQTSGRLEMPLRLDSTGRLGEDGTLPPDQLLERSKYDAVVQSKLDEALLKVEAMRGEGNEGRAGDISLRDSEVDALPAFVPRQGGTRRVRVSNDAKEAAAYTAIGGTVEMAGSLAGADAGSTVATTQSESSFVPRKKPARELQSREHSFIKKDGPAEEARQMRGMHGADKPQAETLERLEALLLQWHAEQASAAAAPEPAVE